MKKVFLCGDTVTGIYSGIYDAWKLTPRVGEVGIAIQGMVEQELFCEYIETEEHEKKAVAVERLIRNHLGYEAYGALYQAILSPDSKKGDAVLNTMLAAKEIPDSHKIMHHLKSPYVQKVFELSRSVGNEAHSFKEFLRFRELENGILFAKINPKSQVLTCIANHFANRLPLENWLIYDETHKMTLVHEARKQWILLVDETMNLEKTKYISEEERVFEKLWKGFCETISVKERENRDLQRQHLPIRYRHNLVEFTKEMEE